MFLGLHDCLMDEKGRLAFPSPLRTSLEQHGVSDRFMLTQSFYEPCLVAMTEAEFAAQAEKVRGLPPSNPAVMKFKRFVIAPATLVVIDKAGRVNIPKELRDYAGLEREATWAGVLERIELWSKARWQEHSSKHLQDKDDLEQMRGVLENYGL
jgi:MraZ protein